MTPGDPRMRKHLEARARLIDHGYDLDERVANAVASRLTKKGQADPDSDPKAVEKVVGEEQVKNSVQTSFE